MIVHYVSGSRADFGLMRNCLGALAAAEGFDVALVVTGQATVGRYGDVRGEIKQAGLRIAHTIPVSLNGSDGREMALAMANELAGFTDFWSCERPDLVLLLGDRGEMLAGALAAFHLEIPVAHLHGGERSGTLDEGFRHAISKLANYHFVASQDSRERLVHMGEREENIRVVGAPGLVDVVRTERPPRSWLFDRFALPAGDCSALMLFHPVVQERQDAFAQTAAIVAALASRQIRTVVLRPNSDAGGAEIERCLSELSSATEFAVLNHLPRTEFLQALGAADLLIGNSSAGIIESASLGTPAVNLGSRQEGRLRNPNVVDCGEFEISAIGAAIDRALAMAGPFENLYGDGKADRKLVDAIAGLPQVGRAPKKRNAY